MRFFLLLVAFIVAGALLMTRPVQHKYSNVPGQDHPYCPPDPRECD